MFQLFMLLEPRRHESAIRWQVRTVPSKCSHLEITSRAFARLSVPRAKHKPDKGSAQRKAHEDWSFIFTAAASSAVVHIEDYILEKYRIGVFAKRYVLFLRLIEMGKIGSISVTLNFNLRARGVRMSRTLPPPEFRDLIVH